jgi:hypothetical protein
MSQSIDGARKVYKAAEAGAANSRWYISDASTSPKTVSLCTAVKPAIGYNEAAVLAADDLVTLTLVNKEGTVKAIANGAITGGNNVYAAADGEVASSGHVIEGVAQETVTADGDIVEVLPVAREVEGVANTAGVGITGTAAVWATSVEVSGDIIKTTLLVDLTGLNSGGTADDIIGADGAGVAHLGQITAAVNGTIFAGRLTCLETPATGDDDIDVHSATEATGVEDTAISALTETKLCNSGDLTAGTTVLLANPAADQYLYLTGGTGDSDATYTAGILMLEFWGKAA